MIIALLRHGESQANVQGLISSQPSDLYRLTPLGRKQIRNLTRHSFFEKPVTAVYSSPFLRTIESATVLTKNISKLPRPITDGRIAEMNFGSFSGKKQKDVHEEVTHIFEQSFAGNHSIRMSPTGENRHEFLTRTYGFLASLLESNAQTDRMLVITHSSVIAVLEKLWIQLKAPDFKRSSTQNAELKVLEFDKNDAAKIREMLQAL